MMFNLNSGSSTGNWSYGFNPGSQKFEKNYNSSAPGLNYRYDGIVLASGGKKKPEFSWKDWLSYSLVNDINDVENYHYKLGSYLQIIQNFVNYIEKSGAKNMTLVEGKEYYNVNKASLKNKTLYINPSELPEGINTLSQVKEVYKYNVKLASEAEIKSAIDRQDENVVVLNNVCTGKRYYPYFFETKEAKIIYLDMDRNYLINPAKSIKKLLSKVSTE